MRERKERVVTGSILFFGEGLFDAVMSGVETLTIRRYRPEAHDFKEGDLITGRFRDGYDVQLVARGDTVKKPFSDITDEEARKEGSVDAQTAFENLKSYYPGLRRDELAALIPFGVVRSEGNPVLKPNEYFDKNLP